ncbi:hypothetical protein VitviT2T_000892 [Vitis vinifera]|uniref:Uncharacterized protein n=1 Tax=Vitis vinifera TaxID=29760 RepID=A0ABY9BDW0_VITVI|nr:hypothetical protein VitviT2T_000892 [Vitis vinifera]
MLPQWSHKNVRFLIFLHSKRKIDFTPRIISSSINDDSVPKQPQLGYDPSVELFGLEVDLQPRNVTSDAPKIRSWFGPNGQYIRELPCPSCRGRGYTPCTECGIERSRLDCSQCNGKGMQTCRKCFGDCVIWEESIDERPWEKARSVSPLKVKEDDEVDNLDIKLDVRRKSKRVYQSPSPEVGLKISRSLKSLNAKTGLFSKRMKIIHRDPKLHAQRVAAIKKAKGTAAARKRASEALKAFFRDPENRRKRSIAMKGLVLAMPWLPDKQVVVFIKQFGYLEVPNFTVKTADVKVIGDTTVLNSPIVQWIGGSDVGYVGKRAIIEEPVGGQEKVVPEARFQGITIVGYVVIAAITAGHALKVLG